MASDSPFGAKVRKRALARYAKDAGPVTALNAWEHVYRLLLSIDRRTRLAHAYDSNHMQPGGTFYSRAGRFTELLCEAWSVAQRDLPQRLVSSLRLFHRVFLTLFRDSTGAVSRFARSLPHSGAEDGKREAGGSASPAGLSTVLGLR